MKLKKWLEKRCSRMEAMVTYRCGRKCNSVDGEWGEFGKWDECVGECDGPGYQSRVRFCDNPAPVLDGAYCEGSPLETRSCSAQCYDRGIDS